MIISYKLNSDGQVVRQIVHKTRLRGEQRPDRHFSETILKAYYSLECNQKFRSTYTKNQIKNAHSRALERAGVQI